MKSDFVRKSCRRKRISRNCSSMNWFLHFRDLARLIILKLGRFCFEYR